ncbi:MAG: hypothetical protein PHI03_04760 [Bacteroidales bacterium]|nr:hypothetical protein [Bacteroidales bacterium]
MKILFRVDAGGKTGLGHFYRSLSLARELHSRGHIVIFSHLKSDFWDAVINNDFPFQHIELDNHNSENETKEFIFQKDIDVFYVDGIINFNKEFIDKVKSNSIVIFYQNLSPSRVYADIFIIPSIHQDDSFYQSFTENTRIYKGLEFFTFHPFILNLKPKVNINPTLSSIAVSAGGSDPNRTLLAIYSLVSKEISKSIKFVFYYGKDFLHKESIPSKPPANIQFLPFNHADILKNDILITSFGVSTYEFLYLGIPIMSYGHQISNARASDFLESQTNSLISLGEINKITSKKFKSAFVNIEKQSVRKELSNKAKRMLDLKGTKRIVEIIEASKLN